MGDPGAESEVRAVNDAFYKALSAGSIDGISAACVQDDDVTCLHENSKEVSVVWKAVLNSWKAVPFDDFAESLCAMADPMINMSGSSARVVGFEKIRGIMKDGQKFAFTALGTNIYESRDGKWLIVHHHASKAAENLIE